MLKRQREENETSRPPKRSKPEPSHNAPAPEPIHFAHQLQQLLIFRPDGIQQLRNGIASFKAFLESILYHRDEDNRARELSILREFLENEKPAQGQELQKPILSQLWQAWSFANQNSNDYLVSSVSAIIALLVRTLSSVLDLRQHGYDLCRTVLQHQHLRLIRRCLDAPKHKEFIISPSLRLLTEVASFDGGTLAKDVYKNREQTFDINSLRRNLGLLRTEASEEEAQRKPSVRTLTVRYVLAHLKCLYEGAKIDLLKSRPLCIALFQHLADDPLDVVNAILSFTEQSVLKDAAVARVAKATLLNQHNLARVTEVATRSREDHPAAERALAWLKAVCTTSSYGVLRSGGWYPARTAKLEEHANEVDSAINLGLDSLEFYDRSERTDVRNSTLLGWLRSLRPHSDPKEREVVLTCFEAAPELVAAYFAEKNMQLDPKLSNTWFRYASFLFEVIRLPVPSHLGNAEGEGYAELPPQSSVVLDSLLPQPLTQKVLTRCLNQSSELITFFAVRLLVLAFQKLATVMSEMRKAAEHSTDYKALWIEATERLLACFTERTPLMKDVIGVFRKTPDDEEHVLQRETIARLLRLYYEVTSLQAMEEQFDVSTALTAALGRDTNDARGTGIGALRSTQLEHLLVVAQHSPGMRWFSKQGGLEYSPVVVLLRLHASHPQNHRIRELLLQVLTQYDILTNQEELEALLASLLGQPFDDDGVMTFIDDCVARAARQPVKYVDQLDTVRQQIGNNNLPLPGLLAAAVVEQIKFVINQQPVTLWAYGFLSLGTDAGNANTVTSQLFNTILEACDLCKKVKSSAVSNEALLQKVRVHAPSSCPTDQRRDVHVHEGRVLHFSVPPTESDNHPELLRLSKKDVVLAIEDGDVAAVILCLNSQHADIRHQAHIKLPHLWKQLRDATGIDASAQLAVLIGQLVETYEQHLQHSSDKPLPYLVSIFAVRAMEALQDAAHDMYPKINKYIMKGAEWRVSRLPAHWLATTVGDQPFYDDAYWREVLWVLDWLVDGVRTAADVDLMRKGGVFEKMMALYVSPAAARNKDVRQRIMETLYRTTCIRGGSDVLITRAGVLSWLKMLDGKDDVAGLIRHRLLETSDRERVQRWSGVPFEKL